MERDGDRLKSILYEPTTFSEFVSHGWELWRGRHRSYHSSQSINSVTHRVLESSGSLLTPNLEEDKETNMCVDGETVPLAGPVEVRVVKDPIMMFCSEAEAATEKREETSTVSRWSSLGPSLVRQNKLLQHSVS